jgi:hypothetical protein
MVQWSSSVWETSKRQGVLFHPLHEPRLVELGYVQILVTQVTQVTQVTNRFNLGSAYWGFLTFGRDQKISIVSWLVSFTTSATTMANQEPSGDWFW